MRHVARWFGLVVLGILAGYSAVASAQTSVRHAQRAQSISCSSDSNQRRVCRVPGWDDAKLVRQISKTRCERGRNWGLQRGVLWVDNGCRGTFAQVFVRRNTHDRRGQYGTPGNRHGSHAGNLRPIAMNCGSQSNDYRLCQVDIGQRGSVRLDKQVSKSACVFNRSWGWNRQGVWVNHGCRGRFVVSRGSR